ncbi:MAG TPA: hypothetical protein PJ991_04450 [Kiritimatiellia bacterium]|mgnify:CR=1 FL=1|nr:hypothetical protein [Kiritimatiellia bacterium]
MDEFVGDDEQSVEKKENILLDARLLEMIDKRAFRAVLGNGHKLVVYIPRGSEHSAEFKAGDTVVVDVSPFDMGRGAIVSLQEN